MSDQRTRVLLFTNSVAVGGMEEHVKLLARHLDRRRLEVFAVCPQWEPTQPFSNALRELVDHFAEITPDRRHGRARVPFEVARFAKQMRDWKIDVAHFHSTTYRGQTIALGAARLGGVRRVYVTEHLAPEQVLPARERFKRSAFSRLFDGVVCVSQMNYERRAGKIYTPPDKAFVVNNGVDINDFQQPPESVLAELRARHDIPAGAEVIGTAVRFEPEKGLEYLMDAFPLIKAARPNALLLMVGDGSLRNELQAHAERLGFASSVRFVGFQRDCRPYYALMDVFVLPVPWGSGSIGILEAMAMRLPTVISFGVKGEATVDGENGFWAEPRSSRAIAEHSIRILSEPGLKQRFAEAARQRIERFFSAQRVARVLGELYCGQVLDEIRPDPIVPSS